MSENGIFAEDNLLDQISYRELIVTLHCNEKVIDEKAVRRVLKEIQSFRQLDLEDRLQRNMKHIIAESKRLR
jgi:hypothetical protein